MAAVSVNSMTTCQWLDIHYHAAPDLYIRRHDAITAGEIYQSLQTAVVLKSHLGATSIQATLAQRKGLPVLPSVALNTLAGGIDYKVVQRALVEYQPMFNHLLLVDFPTITGRSHTPKVIRHFANEQFSELCLKPATVFNEQGVLSPETIDVLKMACDYPIVLSTGHASKQEVYALIEGCIRYGVPKLLLNQPANPLTGLDAEELGELVQHDFVWIEQTLLTLLLGYQTKQDLTKVLTDLPRVIYSSDLGQPSQPDIEECMTISQALFAEVGLDETRINELTQSNPISFLQFIS